MANWQPNSWQNKPYEQKVTYPEPQALADVTQQLMKLPPLVTTFEIEDLKQQLAEAALGKRFLLQGGDCAESFADCNQEKITNKLRIILQMSLILIHGLHKPITRVGRMAGQYAKPRSADTETINNITLPTYRGDLINHFEFDLKARTPNPKRMLEGYKYAALTLNYVRALMKGGFADLYHPEFWNLGFAQQAAQVERYHKIVHAVQNALQFMKTIGAETETLKGAEFYISHEALHLPYETAFTQEFNGQWYNLSTHFPWLGMRTARLDGAHIEYMRGIVNPIAVKISAKTTVDWIQQLVSILNPNNEPGRLTLITRLGAAQVKTILPTLIKAVQQTGIIVLWSCDPMHGNTITTAEGFKTRKFNDILQELSDTYLIHQQLNSYLGGVHFELTGENVTECTGGASGINDSDLTQAYQTLVDPRLNYEQALEMALLLADLIQ